MGGKMFQTTNQFSLWACQLSFLVTQNPHGFAKFAWNNLMVFHIKIPLNRYYTPKSPHQIFHCNYLYPIKYHYIPLIINTIYHWNTEKRNRYLGNPIPMIRVYIYIHNIYIYTQYLFLFKNPLLCFIDIPLVLIYIWKSNWIP